MIPKVIHYCWFGKNKKSKLIKKCIKTWKKYCPDYKIVEWNEDNFNVNCNKYVKEAYENKKWAFVSDYARLWILYNNGGIYLDTDVKLIKNLDSVLNCELFFASEDNVNINTGLGCGAIKGNEIIKKMMDDYNNISFIKDDGSFDLTTCVIRNSNCISMELDKVIDKSKKFVDDKFTYYPAEFFCPFNNLTRKTNITANSIGIHLFNASWKSRNSRIKDIVLLKIRNIFGERLYLKIKNKMKK